MGNLRKSDKLRVKCDGNTRRTLTTATHARPRSRSPNGAIIVGIVVGCSVPSVLVNRLPRDLKGETVGSARFATPFLIGTALHTSQQRLHIPPTRITDFHQNHRFHPRSSLSVPRLI